MTERANLERKQMIPPSRFLAYMEDGTIRNLTTFEEQREEPAMRAYEHGVWATATEDGAYYFVSITGRVDVHDEETGECVRFGAGEVTS